MNFTQDKFFGKNDASETNAKDFSPLWIKFYAIDPDARPEP